MNSPIKIVGDTHVHTIMSGHAHSTVLENLQVAKQKGHKFLFVTDHTGAMNMSPDRVANFLCLKSTLPDMHDGLYIIRGCEASIVDCDGGLDLPEDLIARNEWVIASLHAYVFPVQDFETTTNIWLKVAENLDIDVIGHCDEDTWKFDYEKVLKKFKEYGKIVEINSNSLRVKKGCKVNCREIALLCKKYEIPVVVSSDAHFAPMIGNVSESIEMLSEIDFPEKLILNADCERLAEVLSAKSGRCFNFNED